MDPRRAIPSMFHRRLALLGVVIVGVMLILFSQLFRLAVVQGAERRAIAMRRLDVQTYLPTWRGTILDRNGRVLAMDAASHDVAVEYAVITGTWTRDQASAQARKEIGRGGWATMDPDDRENEIVARLPDWNARIDRLWNTIRLLGRIDQLELDRRLDAVKRDVQTTAAAVWDEQRRREKEKYGEDDDESNFSPMPIREQTEAHVILARVPEEVAFEFRRLSDEMPGMIQVIDSRRREYPWTTADVPLDRSSLPAPLRNRDQVIIRVEGVADHILGAMRDDVWEEDVARRPYLNPSNDQVDLGWYRPGDSVGARGLELIFEDSLRGLRGMKNARKDTGAVNRVDPQPGHDLQVTLDIGLQARVQAVLSPDFGLTRVQPWHRNTLPQGRRLNAAAVVIEVETGEILAMVSMPTIAMGAKESPLDQSVDSMWTNRPVEAVYPPGSILKPLVLSAAVAENVFNLGDSIECRGHYFPDKPLIARCWIDREKYPVRQHGSLPAPEALARSCNIFFYTLGDRLGMDRLSMWIGRFGLGRPLDVGLLSSTAASDGSVSTTGENGGTVPTQQVMAALRARGDLKFSQIILGIGQGEITWTPVQAANAYATIARGGTIRDASLLMDVSRARRVPRQDLHLGPQLVDAVLDGLRQGVTQRYGTSNHLSYDDGTADEPLINASGVMVWAKTGTAQAPPLRAMDTNGDGLITSKDDITADHLDHAWFVGMVAPAGARRPTHAIAVVVEYGGSGGRCAGPIGNQIIRALQSEGYLPAETTPADEVIHDIPSGSVDEPLPEDEHT